MFCYSPWLLFLPAVLLLRSAAQRFFCSLVKCVELGNNCKDMLSITTGLSDSRRGWKVYTPRSQWMLSGIRNGFSLCQLLYCSIWQLHALGTRIGRGHSHDDGCVRTNVEIHDGVHVKHGAISGCCRSVLVRNGCAPAFLTLCYAIIHLKFAAPISALCPVTYFPVHVSSDLFWTRELMQMYALSYPLGFHQNINAIRTSTYILSNDFQNYGHAFHMSTPTSDCIDISWHITLMMRLGIGSESLDSLSTWINMSVIRNILEGKGELVYFKMP